MPSLRVTPLIVFVSALALTAPASAQISDPDKAPDPGRAWFNLCAAAYNAGKMDEAVRDCEKAIAIDPTRADAWFIKASALYGQGTLDKANHYVLPPGTLEALRRYLTLAPDGPHAADVKAMLDTASQL